MISIVYKTADFVIINKPAGIPSQADRSGDDDAIKQCAAKLSSLGERGELYLINRLDRVVGGLMLLARNKSAAADLSELLSNGIIKEYRAVVEGNAGEGVMKDYLYKDSILGKAFVVKDSRSGAKEAELEFSTIDTAESGARQLSLVRVLLKTGRYHQIRAQFSSRKMPLVGDKKYGSRDYGTNLPSLYATRLAFRYKNIDVDVTASPDSGAYPWTLFKGKI